ncbi:MAG: hypothetical protein A2381_08220 [Bdellovibrionales bacterium RIFOXYB1_FULL_37_110]|nr:MAG: hypothetical protein A2181_04985 [Bdellovibrionales bacterium RIFOXYA1_FULL_38_20]OFZ52589.1 MAG: hypothetical protein A2417_00940 [Bdellovibrionales bacterium RIFOXYC1_FULL_37_79]OFZ59791.1 MAG: hypothetical protein A2381_08220 [Bdellovibrionales bacterium RIFOXYB1_FULL_37_110]OFZ65302.1 MAG: hypothetical protein A2577_04110 [Bdellovibrionales bacterium RIFOXYD1_FULL_36_51]
MNLKNIFEKGEKDLSLVKVTIAGIFMGMANLVPGISGGTMVLAMGLYEEFIESLSNISRFKFTKKNVLFFINLFAVSFLTIFALAGIVQFLMENYLSAMLSLFIGLTLGGAPTLKNGIGKFDIKNGFAVLIGILIMAIVSFGLKPGGQNPNLLLYAIGGFVGSSAMILPGISGSYLLLVMGLYLPVIAALNDFKHALMMGNLAGLIAVSVDILIPFSIGLVGGVFCLSNLLKYLMKKIPTLTMAFLLGILLGSVLGLYPFKMQDFSRLTQFKNQHNELVFKVFGLEKSGRSEFLSSIAKLGRDDLKVIVDEQKGRLPTIEDVQIVREKSEILIVYNKSVDRNVREFAADKKLGKIPLIIVSDTSFSMLRLVLVLILMVVGFFTTKLLGKKEIQTQG